MSRGRRISRTRRVILFWTAAALIAVQVPAVQTAIVGKVTDKPGVNIHLSI